MAEAGESYCLADISCGLASTDLGCSEDELDDAPAPRQVPTPRGVARTASRAKPRKSPKRARSPRRKAAKNPRREQRKTAELIDGIFHKMATRNGAIPQDGDGAEDATEGEAAPAPAAPTKEPRGSFLQRLVRAGSMSNAAGGAFMFDAADHEAISRDYGLSVEQVHARLRQRLPKGAKVSLATTRHLVRDHGANNFGRLTSHEADHLIDHYLERAEKKRKRRRRRLPLPRALRDKWKALKRRHRVPQERHVHASLVKSQAALRRPLPRPLTVAWYPLVDPQLDDEQFQFFWSQLKGPELCRVDPFTKNSVLMFAAQMGNLRLVRELMARDAVRQKLVGAKNAAGSTALDFATARGDADAVELISTYSRGHLCHHAIGDGVARTHVTRGYHVARGASCASRRGVGKNGA